MHHFTNGFEKQPYLSLSELSCVTHKVMMQIKKAEKYCGLSLLSLSSLVSWYEAAHKILFDTVPAKWRN